MRSLLALPFILALTCLDVVPAQKQSARAMKIDVDATQVARRLIHSHIEVPVTGRNITLYYPLWNPGDHAPIQGVGQIGSLIFHAGNQTLVWRRDLVNANSFHVTVPRGTKSIDADFDYFLPAPGEAFADSSQHLLILRWNLYVLYLAGQPVRNIRVRAAATLPPGWKFGTALPIAAVERERIAFKEASLETVVDSPVLTGEFMRTVQLTADSAVAKKVDVAAESVEDLPSEESVSNSFAKLVHQAQLLFGSEHYRSYHFLIALSDYTTPGGGFEHSESGDNRMPANYFRSIPFDIIPHELVHSWNGKYRRPVDLYPPDYQQAEKTDLLWVYESLTDYLGIVLTSRSGFWTDDYARERWAALAARVDHETGRTWRNMQDTADSAPLIMNELFFSNPGWSSWLRMLDYYDEGALLWLEVDEIIAERTHGQRSLKDFIQAFYGGPSPKNSAPQVKTYTKEDVFEALQRVEPYAWRSFFESRLTSLSPHAPMGGLEKSGWRLVYSETPNAVTQTLMYSLGLSTDNEGKVVDVERGGPCDDAGVVPGMSIVTVNGESWDAKKLRSAVIASRTTSEPIRLRTQIAGTIRDFNLNYHGGVLYPHLERVNGRPDTLTSIMHPIESR